MDAMIMEGKELRAGAVAGVHRLRNPVSLARLVLTKVRGWLCTEIGLELYANL